MEDVKYNAGVICRILNEKVIMSVPDLKLYVNIPEKGLYMAIGWLACEGKIHVLTDENNDWEIVLF